MLHLHDLRYRLELQVDRRGDLGKAGKDDTPEN